MPRIKSPPSCLARKFPMSNFTIDLILLAAIIVLAVVYKTLKSGHREDILPAVSEDVNLPAEEPQKLPAVSEDINLPQSNGSEDGQLR